jgi:hypothetical protein
VIANRSERDEWMLEQRSCKSEISTTSEGPLSMTREDMVEKERRAQAVGESAGYSSLLIDSLYARIGRLEAALRMISNGDTCCDLRSLAPSCKSVAEEALGEE